MKTFVSFVMSDSIVESETASSARWSESQELRAELPRHTQNLPVGGVDARFSRTIHAV